MILCTLSPIFSNVQLYPPRSDTTGYVSASFKASALFETPYSPTLRTTSKVLENWRENYRRLSTNLLRVMNGKQFSEMQQFEV